MRRFLILSGFIAVLISHACLAGETVHFNPDTDPSRLDWRRVEKIFGAPPNVRGQRFGAVIKTQTNEYWRLMAAGYRTRAAVDGVKLDIQAAQSESDPTRQLAILENMIASGYRGVLISPQSALNLQPAIEDAVAARVPLINVDGAVADSVTHFVGAVNSDMGARVAKWFIKHYPDGGNIAVITGQPGVLSTVQRTAGFIDTLQAAKKFKIVATPSGDWEQQKSFELATSILHDTPDLIGIYCNNDVMALGAVEAVKVQYRSKQVRVFGTDGTRDAYKSIAAGDLTGTVDIFPKLVGEIGLEMAERLSVGQPLPRVIITPQALVTIDNASRYLGDDKTLQKILLEDLSQDN